MNSKAWTALWMLAVFCLAAIALGDLIVPKPKNPYSGIQKSRDIKQLQASVKIQQEDLQKAKSTVDRYIWNVGLDQITSKSLDYSSKPMQT